jgi:hypothetical protein
VLVPTTHHVLGVPVHSDSPAPLSVQTNIKALSASVLGGTPVHCGHRGGTTGRVLRVLAAHAVRHCAVRSCRTGAAVRGYSTGYSAVRAHRYVREGRADDADMAFAAVQDTHEPAVITGLHTPRRAKLAAAPAQGSAGGTPLRHEY